MRPRIRYKYCDQHGIEILRSRAIRIKSPRAFNDPFEIRPKLDEESKNQYVSGHEGFWRQALGIKYSFMENTSLVDIPVENIVDFDAPFHYRVREFLDQRFRVLCLTPNPKNIIMWGHYADMHRGILLGIDVNCSVFPTGISRKGYQVKYVRDRSEMKFPAELYNFLPQDINGSFITRSDQLVTMSNIIMTAAQRSEIVQEKLIQMLTYKYKGWQYEREERWIYDLVLNRGDIQLTSGFDVIPLAEGAIRSLVFGYATPRVVILESLDIIATWSKPPSIYYASFHPYKYEVLMNRTDAQYLRDLYKHNYDRDRPWK